MNVKKSKKAKKSTDRKPRNGKRYAIIASKFKTDELAQHEKVIFNHLKSHGPLTTGELATALDGKFADTKQPATSVVGFWLHRWKAAKKVSTIAPEKAAKATKKVKKAKKARVAKAGPVAVAA